MAKNKTSGDNQRKGAVKTRSQIKNPVTGTWTKRNDKSGKFMDVKADIRPFKGVRKAKAEKKPSAALLAIREALFPKPRKRKDGIMLCADAYYELEGARIDLEHQKADKVCIRTIARVQQQIIAVSKILQREGAK